MIIISIISIIRVDAVVIYIIYFLRSTPLLIVIDPRRTFRRSRCGYGYFCIDDATG
jgi:hypothetical protein